MSSKALITGLIAIIILAGLGYAAWVYFGDGDTTGNPTAQEGVAELPDPVAEVDGEEITRADVETLEVQLAASQGVTDLSTLDANARQQLRTQAVDALIARALLLQAAASADITVTAAQVDARLQETKNLFADEAQYQEALTAQGITEANLREQLEADLITQAYLEEELELSSITATDQEIENEYAQAAAAAGAEAPELSEVRDQVEAFVIQQKQQNLLNNLIQQLRADADVEVFI